jgi:hypothetical protein
LQHRVTTMHHFNHTWWKHQILANTTQKRFKRQQHLE